MNFDKLKTIKVMNEGKEVEAKVITYFELDGKNYLLYSLNGDDVLASFVSFENGEIKLEDVSLSDKKMIENVIEDIVMEEGENNG